MPSGTLPGIITDLISILSALAPVACLACFVLAGLRLRAEGGVNYDAGGGFFKWMLWGVVFLTLPGITLYLQQHNIPIQTVTFGSTAASQYVQKFEAVAESFVNDIVVARLVPLLAATLVVKAVLDSAEGDSPLPSAIAALFLLGVQGLWSMVMTSWMNPGDPYETTDMLQSMWSYLANSICPLIGGLCISAAILSYVRNRPWGHLVATGLAFLGIPGLWILVKAMAGVTLSW